MSRVSVIIPCREDVPPVTTLRSLNVQTYTDFSVRWVYDEGKGKGWACNRGFDLYGSTELIVFSDDDIQWKPQAIGDLVNTIDAHPNASFAYGAFLFTGDNFIYGLPNSPETSVGISGNCIMRSNCFPRFDETLKRLVDCDLFMSLTDRGCTGVYCGRMLFETGVRDGISRNGEWTFEYALEVVQKKHGLWKEPPCQELPEMTCSVSAAGTDTTGSA